MLEQFQIALKILNFSLDQVDENLNVQVTDAFFFSCFLTPKRWRQKNDIASVDFLNHLKFSGIANNKWTEGNNWYSRWVKLFNQNWFKWQ